MMHRRVLSQAFAFLAGSALLAGCATTAMGPIGPKAANQARAGNALLYVSDPGTATVGVYSYPALKLKATLTGIKYPVGLCVDPNTQDIWVVDASELRQVVEFKHGATRPIRTLKIDAYYPILNACAVNPQNGDLAVTSMIYGSDPGGLMIYKNARGKAHFYGGVMFYYDFVGYDANGDAFVDGNDYHFVLAELAPGSKKLQIVTPYGLRIRSAGGVQYDGSNVAVGNSRHGVIYQVADGVVTGETTLSNACRVGQFFIDGAQVIVPTKCRQKGRVLIYSYPTGGAPIGELDGLKNPTAVAISR